MAYDKVVDSTKLDAGLKAIADSVRAKSGTSAQLNFPDGFTDAVKAIQTSKPEQTKAVKITQNGTTTVTPDSGNVLSSVVVNVNVPDSKDTEDALIERSLSVYENNRVKTVGAYTLYRSNLTSIHFDAATTIATSAFEYCTKLTIVSFPKVKTVLSSVFANCAALQAAEFHEVESFSSGVFAYDKALKKLVIRTASKVVL